MIHVRMPHFIDYVLTNGTSRRTFFQTFCWREPTPRTTPPPPKGRPERKPAPVRASRGAVRQGRRPEVEIVRRPAR